MLTKPCQVKVLILVPLSVVLKVDGAARGRDAGRGQVPAAGRATGTDPWRRQARQGGQYFNNPKDAQEAVLGSHTCCCILPVVM